MSYTNEEAAPREVLDSIVSLEWDSSGPTSVILVNDWQQQVSPAQLLGHLLEMTQQELGEPLNTSSWRSHLSVKDVPVYRLKEFNTLVSEARAEQRLEPRAQVQTISSSHFESRWLRGGLVGLVGDEEWMVSTTRQAIADELVQVLTRPIEAEATSTPTAARERIVRFLEDCKERAN